MEHKYMQNCLFNFTTQLHELHEDVGKLIWVGERSFILTDKQKWKAEWQLQLQVLIAPSWYYQDIHDFAIFDL